MKVAFLIPSTTRKRPWRKMEDTYLYKIFGQSFIRTISDDIMFQNIDWLSECIEQFKKQTDIGICGPINPPNYRILTQTLVSKKHWEIFGYYFPPQIKNWWCDDWINYVYYPHYVTKMKHLIAENKGGEPRYEKPKVQEHLAFRNLCLQLTVQGKRRIKYYLDRS